MAAGTIAGVAMCMDDPSLLREAAAELHVVALQAGDPNGPLSYAVRLAASPDTWRGPFATGFVDALNGYQRSLLQAAEGLERVVAWLEQVADERQAAATLPGLPGAP